MDYNRSYKLGASYIDKGSTRQPEDQFLRWINIQKSGMLNTPGIRPLNYTKMPSTQGMPAYLILVTNEKSGGAANPWEDSVDMSAASILYWGDAKRDERRSLDDFRGNACLRKIHDYMLDGNRDLIPPILHFTKPATGTVRFNGLCVLNRLETSWFDDHGSPIRNYHAHLTILDCEAVSVDWLHHRAQSATTSSLDQHPECPVAWKEFIRGRTRPIDIWMSRIRSTDEQLPPLGGADDKLLEQLVKLDPFSFEKVVVAIFRSMRDITHHVTGTKATGDGGFDFHGRFRLPPPISYEIPFRGEVKRYSRGNPVDPKNVSRLVARLARGQYGIFVTTSFFTRQAQREVLEDGYPVHLIAGADLAGMLRHLKLSSGDRIDAEWLGMVTAVGA